MLQRALGKIHPYTKATRLGNVYFKRERLLCSAFLFCCPNSYACRAGREVKAAMTITRGTTEAPRHLHTVALKQPGLRIEPKSGRKKNKTKNPNSQSNLPLPQTMMPTATILCYPSGRKGAKKQTNKPNQNILRINTLNCWQQTLLIITSKC